MVVAVAGGDGERVLKYTADGSVDYFSLLESNLATSLKIEISEFM